MKKTHLIICYIAQQDYPEQHLTKGDTVFAQPLNAYILGEYMYAVELTEAGINKAFAKIKVADCKYDSQLDSYFFDVDERISYLADPRLEIIP